MLGESSARSDLKRGVDELLELLSKQGEQGVLTDECLSTEDLLDIMRGKPARLSAPQMEAHFQSCSSCKEHVDYANQEQKEYEQRKQEFLTSVGKRKSGILAGRWILHAMKPVKTAIRPSMAWAAVAIATIVLASLPSILAPRRESPQMMNALRKISGLPVEDVDSAQRTAAQLKNATMRGAHTEPAELRQLRNAVEHKLEVAAGDQKLERSWTSVLGDVDAAEFLNQYQVLASTSGSVDSLQTLDVKDARIENHVAILEVARLPQDAGFESLVRKTNNQVGLEEAKIIGPNNFVQRIK